MNEIFKAWRNLGQKQKDKTLLFLKRLKTKDEKKIDKLVVKLNDEVFEKVDCLQCANCCKTLSPIVKTPDIERISSHLKMRQSVFIDKYMKIDEDGDYVFNSTPCPFLDAENYCLIYDVRPRDCRDYPHTDRQGFTRRVYVNTENTVSCPAVFQIVEELKKVQL
ncbi:hypothetical protein SAMN05421780_10686 [Flexibacter flexilis DSM 6793]|uniref:Zinc-or iron-chelating domain-containing protein n=1 Tax=Flexibacter flexilis DSM 6793 TaxID=927664 RepID=A0A1I1JSR4_9BACT|nr:YkgJ family cysteine cluster protein [Flexibacter flexilis]SFC51556.1 hypothetical protein SAMN05421780_10686 [Flexibacter flexilis DSM 6793]